MISVIIPVHNGIRTLDRAVESVLGQTYCAWGGLVEIILVDDGAQKETARRCDELAEGKVMCPGMPSGESRSDDSAGIGCAENSAETGRRIPSESIIRVFHMEDRGVSAARNLGLERARGEFITFLDDDDAMETGMLEYLAGLHEVTGADICGCGFRSVSPVEAGEQRGAGENNLPGNPTESGRWKVYRGTDIVKERILQRDTRVWSKLFTREAIGETRFLEGLTIGEDMLFVLSLIGENTVYAAGDSELYDYTINPNGAMERPFTGSYMDQIRCWDEAERVIRRNLPSVLENSAGRTTDAAAQLGALRIVSDVLTASKIAKLPDEKWEQHLPEFRICREKLGEHRRIPGSMKRIPGDYRVKSVLLRLCPGIYRRLYRSHG